MSQTDISDRVKEYIFNYIDSVEQLDVLILFRTDRTKSWNAQKLSDELRSSQVSMNQRISALKVLHLLRESPEQPNEYYYQVQEDEKEALMTELFEAYHTRRYRVLELIFSPLKKAKHFADAFQIPGSGGKNGGTHG